MLMLTQPFPLRERHPSTDLKADPKWVVVLLQRAAVIQAL